MHACSQAGIQRRVSERACMPVVKWAEVGTSRSSTALKCQSRVLHPDNNYLQKTMIHVTNICTPLALVMCAAT